jgi:hypothetical protein
MAKSQPTMRAADRASPWWYGAGLLAMVLVCGGVLPVRPAANANRSAIESDTMVPKEPQPVHALRNAQVSTPKRSARKRMATAGNGTAGRKPTSRETTSAVWHSA